MSHRKNLGKSASKSRDKQQRQENQGL